MTRSHVTLFKSLLPLVDIVRKGEKTLGGMKVEDLALTMTVPGPSQVELVPKGSEKIVTGDILPDYILKLVQMLLSTGVSTQLSSFMLGVQHIFDFENEDEKDPALKTPFALFEAEELSREISGTDDKSAWDAETILSSMAFEHGYTRDSPIVRNLANLMASFTSELRRLFLLFVTGAPRLPVGGFPSLSPKFTVTCKRPVTSGSPPSASTTRALSDAMLPSANCCFCLLKLPEYSTPEILKEKVLFAITNCQGSFDLS